MMNNDMNIKVMYLNPIGSSAYDRVFADMIERYKYPSTCADIVSMNPASVPPGMNNLEYRSYESFIINDTVKAARYASEHDYDAMVIGCFYDPALHDAREISSDTVVVAPCQASIVTALTIANSFSILIGKTKWETQMRQTVHEYGYSDKLASFQAVDLRVAEFHKDPDETRKRLQTAAVEAVQVHKAESIILGCTLEIGFLPGTTGLPERSGGVSRCRNSGYRPFGCRLQSSGKRSFVKKIRLEKQQVCRDGTATRR